MNQIRRLLLIGALLLGSVGAQADQIDDYIQAEMKERQIPGLALAVVKDGKVVKLKGYGLANVELNVRVTPDSVFDLASITKQFTAAAIILLVEEGKLGLDDKINVYLPSPPEAWKEITVRHLLTHTAGLQDAYWPTYAGSGLFNYSTAVMYENARKLPLDFTPGERWQYSDQGYFLLGMIIENVSGKRYHELLTERIFQPLGMTATSVRRQNMSEIVKNIASSYALRHGKLVRFRRDVQDELPSAYGLWSTVRDLAKWDAALYTEKILKQSSRELLWMPVKLNNGMPAPTTCGFYGFGWCLDELRGHRVVQHGGITGTMFFHLPEDNLTVIVLTNLGYWDRIRYSWLIAQGVAGLYNPALQPLHRLKEQPDPIPLSTQMLKSLLSEMANETQDSPLMTPGLRARIAATRREGRTAWAAHLKDPDAFRFVACDNIEAGRIERFGVAVNRICYYKLVNAGQTRYFRFYLAADGQVADVRSYTD